MPQSGRLRLADLHPARSIRVMFGVYRMRGPVSGEYEFNREAVMRGRGWFCSVLMLLAPTLAHAQRFEMKNGLWESTFKNELSGMPIPESELKDLSPEQRAQVVEMLKSQSSRAFTHKSCVTDKDREGFFNPQPDPDGTCKTTVVSQTARRIEHRVTCTSREMSTVAMMVAEAVGNDTVRGSFNMKSTTPGKPFETKGTFTSRWLSSDCGNVESASQIRQKYDKK
jgi:hypothetical protein